MNNYVIFADTGADISTEKLAEWGVKLCPLTFAFEGEDKYYAGGDMPVKEFYDRMRAGGVAHTSAMNIETAKSLFIPELEQGNDVLYLVFSSGLSSTYSSARTAAEELMEEYPERKIVVVDSLSASAGHGLLLWLAVRKKREGADIDEVAKFCEDIRLNVCHWFTVDDLVYLKRGGRVSATAAIAGAILGIKPVLHVDDDGHLINMLKVRGRKASIKALADKYGELHKDGMDETVFISNGDCEEDAKLLADMLKERYNVKTELITDIGPVIGAHSGPGTLALFFIGEHR